MNDSQCPICGDELYVTWLFSDGRPFDQNRKPIWLDDGGVYAEWREDGGVTVAECGLDGVFLWPEQQQRLIEVLTAGPPT